MKISYADSKDYPILKQHDKHISDQQLMEKITNRQVCIIWKNNEFIGWLRWGLFWDSIPFLNMLSFLDAWRGKGYGTQAMAFWEAEMKKQGYKTLLVSTQSNETAQHFYVKLGYKAIGGFLLGEEPLELMFAKQIAGVS